MLVWAAGLVGCGGDHRDPQMVPEAADHDRTRVEQENQLAGDPSWKLAAPTSAHEVEGYASRASAAPGDTLQVMVNVDAPKPVRWSLFRLGWYGGAGARKLAEGGPVAVSPQPACPRDPRTSRVECPWGSAFTVAVPADALSGVYLIKLAADRESYVPFVVVDGRTADLVVNVNVTSWQAYNDFGGESLYTDASGTMPHGKAWEVSFDRPYQKEHGASALLTYEGYFLRFVEALGYDVTYTTALDLARDDRQVRASRAFVSLANDEYWTAAERASVESARDAGVNLAFLGADQVLWRGRFQPSGAGVADRVYACYKADQDKDPVLAAQGASAATSRFRDDPDPRPENGLIGVMYDGWMLLAQPQVVRAAAAWPFAGTGLGDGDALPLAVSAEEDARFQNGAEPPGLELLASSPIVDAEEAPKRSAMTYYRAASGAEVFAVGSIGWVRGLGAPVFADSRVARMTRNVLDRFVGDGRKGGPDPDGAPWLAAPPTPMLQPAWARSVATVAGQADERNPGDGPGASARFAGPSGVAVAADGVVYVADAPAHSIRRIDADAARTVTTLAGDGVDGYLDGPGATARFRWPTALALMPDGALLVADSDNHVIRRIAPDAAHTVTTYAGVAMRGGGGLMNGLGSIALFNRPSGLAVAPDGTVFVADMHNHMIRRVDPAAGHRVSTFTGSIVGFLDGAAGAAQFNQPTAVARAADGTLYVLDSFNQAIRRVAADGSVTTIVGMGVVPGIPSPPVDGPASAARIGAQGGLAVAGHSLYFTDVASDRVRALDLLAATVTTVAGSGRAALADGDGSRAGFAAPMALAAASDGSLYVADSGNHAIRHLIP